jgi:hypothetical protein
MRRTEATMAIDIKESMAKAREVKNKFNYRQLFMVVILIFATAADILMDYVTAGFKPDIFYDPAYWIKLVLTCLSVIMVTLAARDFFREKELRDNTAINETQRQIDSAHAELIKRDLTTQFERYVNAINAERKLKAYKEYLQFRISKTKNEKRRAALKKKLDDIATDIEFLPTKGNRIVLSPVCRIKYNRVRIATIFSRVERSKGDDEDIETNEQTHIAELIFKKLFTLIAFTITFSTLFFDPGTFVVSILVNTFSKLFRTAMSIYLGASDGQGFARGTLLSKMKLRLDFIQKFLESKKADLASA